MRVFLAISILFLMLGSNARAQGVKLEATASSKEVAMGDYLQITYSLKNADGNRFEFPNLVDFHVQGPSTSFRQYNFNGKISSEKNFIYTLMPKRTGRFTIPPGSIYFNNKKIKSNSLTINVVKKAASPAGDNVNNAKGVALVAELSKSTGYVGERIYLDYWVYTRHNIESFKIIESPEFQGVSAEDVQNVGERIVNKTLGGIPYTTKLIRRIVLSPQKEGNISIDPMVMRLAVDRNGFGYQIETIASEVKTLNIKSLPKPQPDGFSGTVGNYELAASLNLGNMTTDETLTVTVKITGKGDVKRIAAPQLNLSTEDFDVYDPRIAENSVEQNSEIIHTKTFEYLVSPKTVGTYEVAPSFTFFDPEKGEYTTVKAEAMPLSVLKGTGIGTGDGADGKTIQGDIRGIQADGRLRGQFSFYGSVAFWLLLCVPFIGLGVVLYFKQLQTKTNSIDPITKRRMAANKIAQERLSQAKNYLAAKESRAFYNEISKTVWGYIGDKLNLPISELSKDKVKLQLTEKGVAQNYIEELEKVLQRCEMALFAGMNDDNAMNEVYESVETLLTNVELN